MHIVLNRLLRLVFLIIIVNNFWIKESYSQHIKSKFSKQDSILIKYFNTWTIKEIKYSDTWTRKEIHYFKSDTIKNILNFNFGSLYDTVWVKRDDLTETIDSLGEVYTFETIEEKLYYRRRITFQQLNDSLYVGFALNIYNQNLEAYGETKFDIYFFVFNINKKKLYLFSNFDFNKVINDKLQIKNIVNNIYLCEIYNKYYNCVETITFNNRHPYLGEYGYFISKSKYIIYENYSTILNNRIKISETKKKQKKYFHNYTDIERLKEYLDYIIIDL